MYVRMSDLLQSNSNCFEKNWGGSKIQAGQERIILGGKKQRDCPGPVRLDCTGQCPVNCPVWPCLITDYLVHWPDLQNYPVQLHIHNPYIQPSYFMAWSPMLGGIRWCPEPGVCLKINVVDVCTIPPPVWGLSINTLSSASCLSLPLLTMLELIITMIELWVWLPAEIYMMTFVFWDEINL